MTALQQEIFDYLLVHSWSSAMREYNITSRGTMKTLIIRSAMGYSWYPGHAGGAPPYLNAAKEERLAHLIDDLCIYYYYYYACSVFRAAHYSQAARVNESLSVPLADNESR